MKDKVKRLMITIKNIKNVEYDEETKEPKSFELMIDCSQDVDREDEEHKQLRLIYTRMKNTASNIIWKIETDITDFTPSSTAHHYKILYGIPSKRVSLATTAGMGLYNLQNVIKQEIQYKTMLDFNIGEMLAGMV